MTARPQPRHASPAAACSRVRKVLLVPFPMLRFSAVRLFLFLERSKEATLFGALALLIFRERHEPDLDLGGDAVAKDLDDVVAVPGLHAVLAPLFHLADELRNLLAVAEGAARGEVSAEPSIDVEGIASGGERPDQLHDGVLAMARAEPVVLLVHHRFPCFDHDGIRSREGLAGMQVDRTEAVEPGADHVARRPDHDEDLLQRIVLHSVAQSVEISLAVRVQDHHSVVDHLVLAAKAAEFTDIEDLAGRGVRSNELRCLKVSAPVVAVELLHVSHGEEIGRRTDPISDHGALRQHRGAALGPVFSDHVSEFCHEEMVAAG